MKILVVFYKVHVSQRVLIGMIRLIKLILFSLIIRWDGI